MKKLKTIVLATVFSVFGTIANADMSAGLSVAGYYLSPSATEDMTGAGGDQNRSEDVMAGFVSVFVEKDMGAYAIGVDFVPYASETSDVENQRTDQNGGVANTGNDISTTTAKVSIENQVQLYAKVNGDGNIYGKIGVSYAELKTVETMASGSNYPDEELIGAHLAVGFQKDLADGAFIRAELGYAHFDDIDTASDSGRTKIQITDIGGASGRISVGRAF